MIARRVPVILPGIMHMLRSVFAEQDPPACSADSVVRHDRSRRGRRVALVFDAARSFDAKVATGVAESLRHHDGYFLVDKPRSDTRIGWLPTSSEVDGLIANVDGPHGGALAACWPGRMVGFGLGAAQPHDSIPYFRTNNDAIGMTAVDHLANAGFLRLGFYGGGAASTRSVSDERAQAFRRHAAERGLQVSTFGCSLSPSLMDEHTSLINWVRRLAKPVGIFAADDERGRELIEVCREEGVDVPREVAVIGANNDEVLCQLCKPTLTSIEHGASRIGFAAAARLAGLLDGIGGPTETITVDPSGVVVRLSTDTIAFGDSDVAAAMAFIQEHASSSITVSDVVRAIGISRTKLEGRFRALQHGTVRGAIRRAHLHRARQLVTQTGLPLKQIAAMSGFKSVQHLTTSFRLAFGHTPGKTRAMDR
jgi:LacI family transcriptional regulator